MLYYTIYNITLSGIMENNVAVNCNVTKHYYEKEVVKYIGGHNTRRNVNQNTLLIVEKDGVEKMSFLI